MVNIFKFLKRKDSFQAGNCIYRYVELKGGIGMTITDLKGNPLVTKPVLLSRPRDTQSRRSGYDWFTHG